MHDMMSLNYGIEFVDMWFKEMQFDVRVAKDEIVNVCWDKRSDIKTGR